MQEILDLDPLSVSDDRLSGVRCYDDSTNLLPELKSFIVYNKLLATEEEPMSDGNDARLLTGSELSGGGIRKNLTTDEEKVLGIVSNRFPVSFSSGGGSARNTSRTTFSSFGGGNFPCLQDLIISSSNTVGETDKQNPRDQISSDEYEEETNDYVDGDNEFILEEEDEVDDKQPTPAELVRNEREIKEFWKERDAETVDLWVNQQNSMSWRASKKESCISEKDKEILSLRMELAQSQKKATQLEEAFAIHSCQAERTQRKLERSLYEKDSIIETMKISLAEKDETIYNIRSSYEEFDEERQTLITSLETLRLSLTEKDSEIEDLRQNCFNFFSQHINETDTQIQKNRPLYDFINRLEQREGFLLDENVNDEDDEVKVLNIDEINKGDKVKVIESDESGEGIITEITVNRHGFPQVLVQFGENDSYYYHPKELERVNSVYSDVNSDGNGKK